MKEPKSLEWEARCLTLARRPTAARERFFLNLKNFVWAAPAEPDRKADRSLPMAANTARLIAERPSKNWASIMTEEALSITL